MADMATQRRDGPRPVPSGNILQTSAHRSNATFNTGNKDVIWSNKIAGMPIREFSRFVFYCVPEENP